MSLNFIKLLIISIIISAILGFIGLQVFELLDFETTPMVNQFAYGIAAGAFFASLLTGIFLLLKPFNTTIQKKTLFVGNLAFKASERELRTLFSQYGEVFSIRLMTDRVTRKPRGYGFVEMDSKGAKKALAQLNEEEFMGRDLRVSPANDPSGQ